MKAAPTKALFALMFALACGPTQATEWSARYASQSLDVDGDTQDLTGLDLGVVFDGAGKGRHHIFVLVLGDGTDHKEIAWSYLTPLWEQGATTLEADFGIGYGEVHVDDHRNDNPVATVPITLRAQHAFAKQFFVEGRVGVRYFYDLTENTMCRDGTTSDSTGSGTCSHHGGIDFYQDKLGNSLGFFYSLGLTYRF